MYRTLIVAVLPLAFVAGAAVQATAAEVPEPPAKPPASDAAKASSLWSAAVPMVEGHREFFVAVDGKPDQPGTKEAPWDFESMLTGRQKVMPGDVVWLRGGTYEGKARLTFSSKLRGAPGKPVIIRQFPGERAIVTPTLTIGEGEHVWFWDFEVMNPDTKEYGTVEHGRWPAVNLGGADDIKLIHLVIHEGGQGIGAWSNSHNCEIYGCLSFNNGWAGSNQGHGIYTQNQTGTKTIAENMFFNQLGTGFGIHAYGSKNAYVDSMVFEGNLAFNNRGYDILVGSGKPSKDIVFRNNMAYSPFKGGKLVKFGYTAPYNENAVVDDNYLASGRCAFLKWNTLEVKGNTFIGALDGLDKTQFPDNVFQSTRPSGLKVFVRPSKYEPGRANICIFNWDKLESVPVDVSAVLAKGDAYEVRDAQNFIGKPVAIGVCDGKPLLLPMNLTEVAQPITKDHHEHTPPEFGAFVLLRQAGK